MRLVLTDIVVAELPKYRLCDVRPIRQEGWVCKRMS